MGALSPHEGRRAHPEGHEHRGFVYVDGRQSLRAFRRSNGVADGHVFRSSHSYDIAGVGFGCFNSLHAAEHEDALELVGCCLAVAAQQSHVIPQPQCAIVDAAHGHLAKMVVVVQGRHQHLQRGSRVAGGRRNRLQYRLE